MMLVGLFLLCLAAAEQAPSALPKVHSVEVVGNLRVSQDSILRHISLAPGKPFDETKAQNDLKRLHALGLFRSLQIESRGAGEGQVDVIYKVREYPFVSAVLFEGVSDALEEQIRELLREDRLEIRPASPLHPAVGNRAARAIRSYLRSKKHPLAEVQVVTDEKEGAVQVLFKIQLGRRMELGEVHFVGNKSIPQEELIRQMQLTRTGPFWARWLGVGRFVEEELARDLERVRRYYQSKGFAAVRIGKPEAVVSNFTSRDWFPLPGIKRNDSKLAVTIPLQEGPQFELVSVQVEGDGGFATDEIEELSRGLKVPSRYDLSRLEATRQKMLRSLGTSGYALAQVELEQSVDAENNSVKVVFKLNRGSPVLIGRIEFEGNSRLPDKFLRRELRIGEGQIFNSSKLDESLVRLNKSNLVKDLQREDVTLDMDPDRNLLNIRIRISERDRQGIYATGGTGGIAGGYLGILYRAFNLLGLGETLSLELDGGASQSNLLLNIVGKHFLAAPFTLALSGFHRVTNFNVATVVPGPEDLVHVLRRRSKGIALAGAYSVTSKISVGTALQVEREHIDDAGLSGGPTIEQHRGRSELAPFFIFDSTRSVGPRVRGTQLVFSHAWAGDAFLRPVDATRESFELARYVDDPWTSGRNYFAFRLHTSAVLRRGGRSLRLEQRLFPGNEVVRGMRRGGLSPWVYRAEEGSLNLLPAGADMLVGFSSEYRVPLRAGVSGVAFMDFGWSRLNPKDVVRFGPHARLIRETNGLLRASVGSELRVQLPVIREPARLIFAWNPLRLENLLESSHSPLRLADPRSSIRFALGKW